MSVAMERGQSPSESYMTKGVDPYAAARKKTRVRRAIAITLIVIAVLASIATALLSGGISLPVTAGVLSSIMVGLSLASTVGTIGGMSLLMPDLMFLLRRFIAKLES